MPNDTVAGRAVRMAVDGETVLDRVAGDAGQAVWCEAPRPVGTGEQAWCWQDETGEVLAELVGSGELIDPSEVHEGTFAQGHPPKARRDGYEVVRKATATSADVRAKEEARAAAEASVDQARVEVGERGLKLSGGEKQRLSIARAILKGAEILLLDEATSALDTDTEASIMQVIAGLKNDITTLIIAHRVSTLSNCDFIVTLKIGRAHV